MPRLLLALLAATLFSIRHARADVTLPALVSDGMVLEQRTPVRVWGWAPDGEKVTVSLRGRSSSTVARDGQWSVTLPPLDAGGPFEMRIVGRNVLVVRDVLVGEVWVCSGQSNMEFALERSDGAQALTDAPADPLLRLFTVARQLAAAPQANVSGGAWEHATPRARARFSAVGYYFGRALRAARGVPVGLIHASWGGTPAEAWTSRAALRRWGLPEQAFTALAPPTAAARAAHEQRLQAWHAAGAPTGDFEDPGELSTVKARALQSAVPPSLGTMALPQPWERLGPNMEVDGGIWFRTEVSVPALWAGRALDLHLGAIDDLDTTYFNGVRVGTTGREVPSHWQVPRRYRIPAAAVRAGRGTIAVRVWDHGGEGGLMGPASEMWLAPAGAPARDRVSLAGEWRFEVERARPTMPNPPGLNQNLPSVLYNGMIAPILPYAIKGVAWYQGESNTGRASQYRSLLTAMIEGWRADWRIGDFPFLIVQLAPYLARDSEPRDSDWALLREAQDRVSRELANTSLIVTTDVGDERDIHPTRKQPIGQRLALAARKVAYGEDLVASGPTLRSATLAEGKVILSFDNVGKGLEVRGPRLTGFALAGQDEEFVFAEARVDGDRVSVSSPRVPSPAHVRFGWANYPVVNLWNADGLPAAPFRSALGGSRRPDR